MSTSATSATASIAAKAIVSARAPREASTQRGASSWGSVGPYSGLRGSAAIASESIAPREAALKKASRERLVLPIENIDSRSWREKAAKATIVCVRTTPRGADLAGDHIGELLVVGHADDRHEVPLARHRVGLRDALDVRERAAEVGERVALGFDQHHRIGHRHGEWLLAGLEHHDLPRAAPDSTSALKACTSVTIGGKVS